MEEPSTSFRSFRVSKRKTGHGYTILPVYHQYGGASRRRALSRVSCIHIIPLLVLLCFIILWWFSYPVNLEVKDGRITVVADPDVEVPKFINETRVDLAFLAAIATPPYTSISHMQPVGSQNTAEPVNGTD